MTLTIELTPEEEARLRVAARNAGLDPAECAHRLLREHLPPLPPGQATRALLNAWWEEDATDDPREIRAAEDELATFKEAINATRTSAGSRPLYP